MYSIPRDLRIIKWYEKSLHISSVYCDANSMSDSVWDNIVDEMLPLRCRLTVVLLMAFPQVEEQSKRHRPDLILRQVKLGDTVI